MYIYLLGGPAECAPSVGLRLKGKVETLTVVFPAYLVKAIWLGPACTDRAHIPVIGKRRRTKSEKKHWCLPGSSSYSDTKIIQIWFQRV